MGSTREIVQSPVYQGKDERVAYALTTTQWGSGPTDVTVKIFDGSGTDVSATCLSGTASVAGDIITTPLVVSLTSGVIYRLEIMFTVDGNDLEPYCLIIAED